MTDKEWWDSLTCKTEFLNPPGDNNGLFSQYHEGGTRCCPSAPEEDDPPNPDPEKYGFVEFWGGGATWVLLSEIRKWERYKK